MTDLLDDENVFDVYPQLAILTPLIQLASNVQWFRAVGDRLNEDTLSLAKDYCDGLGYPDATPALLGLWGEAADAVETLDYNSPAWETEEQLRTSLTQQALEQIEEDILEFVFTHIANEVLPAATQGAEEVADFLRIDDLEFVQAAAGAAVQAVHQAALVLLVGEDENHPFAVRFHIFEQGHWPLGIVGNSFNIF